MVVLDILDGRVDQTGPWQNTQGQGGREEVEFAISEAAMRPAVSWKIQDRLHWSSNYLLFAQACPAPLPEGNQVLLERVVLPPILEQESLRDELLRVREQFLVGVLDHRGHAHGRTTRYNPLHLAVLALVDQVFISRDPGGPVREAGHYPQGLVDHGPEVGSLLEVRPLQVERIGAFQGLLEPGEGAGLS